ncbi:MAG TPA: sugar phosphate isomerase/epimerase family protein [bacterium]|nr:sugar phosphate isomerase/epimerase family protein [bacterium]HOL66463.1 sugar phosphate isomerase/epimerase family protein [bacterium]HPP11462.1 sugar phosphate isomerase/epimerase family protein [bacterium]
MKISVYSLSTADRKPAEVVALAQKYGCQGVEWWCKEGGHVDCHNLKASVREVEKLMRESGLETVGLDPYFRCVESAAELEPFFSAARILGARKIRSHSFPYQAGADVLELLKKLRDWLGEVVLPLARQYQVQFLIEQHHYAVCCTPNACRQAVEGLPAEYLGIIYDPGNSLYEGYTRPEYAVNVLGKYLAHVHVKTACPVLEAASVPAGRRYGLVFGRLQDGDLDWEATLAALQKAGYAGFLSLEALDKRDSEAKLREDIPVLKKALEAISQKT